jgi:chromosome partitioning protein
MAFFKKKKTKKDYGDKNATIISVSAQKGGVGKTTFSTNFAVSQALNGKKVLLIDLDSQAHTQESLSFHLGNNESDFSEYIIDSQKDLMNSIFLSQIENLYYVPADKNLAKTEKLLSTEIGKEFVLKKLLDIPKTHFDLIIIDTPPHFGNLTLGALVASKYVIIPTELSNLSIDGINDLLQNMELVVDNYNDDIDILGIVINKVDYRSKKTNDPILSDLRNRFDEYLTEPFIPLSTLFKKAQLSGQSIFHYDKNHKVSKLFDELSNKLIK